MGEGAEGGRRGPSWAPHSLSPLTHESPVRPQERGLRGSASGRGLAQDHRARAVKAFALGGASPEGMRVEFCACRTAKLQGLELRSPLPCVSGAPAGPRVGCWGAPPSPYWPPPPQEVVSPDPSPAPQQAPGE